MVGSGGGGTREEGRDDEAERDGAGAEGKEETCGVKFTAAELIAKVERDASPNVDLGSEIDAFLAMLALASTLSVLLCSSFLSSSFILFLFRLVSLSCGLGQAPPTPLLASPERASRSAPSRSAAAAAPCLRLAAVPAALGSIGAARIGSLTGAGRRGAERGRRRLSTELGFRTIAMPGR